MKIAIIGSGITGLSCAKMLTPRHKVTLYEAADRPGGLVKCDKVDGVLFHRVGGHVFNSRRQDVLDWFWQFFDREHDFHKAVRHAVVSLADGTRVDYPIENHLYQLPAEMRRAAIIDMMEIQKRGYKESHNFDEFLRHRFGPTLYNEYFAPYNSKIWGRELTDVPLEWLEGKLPMPSVPEIMEANIAREGEMKMVHSSFWYPLNGGSQFPVDKLAQDLDIHYNCPVTQAERHATKWLINEEEYDCVFFTGNARILPDLVHGDLNLGELSKRVSQLEYHGTTSVLCEIDKTPYSWIYMPSQSHESHRIICTGNFSPNNDRSDRSTATIEFSRCMSREAIEEQLALIPFHPTYIAHNWEECTYPVQTGTTKGIIDALKSRLHPEGFYLVGRFAEWQYYNQDAAIAAAMDLIKDINI